MKFYIQASSAFSNFGYNMQSIASTIPYNLKRLNKSIIKSFVDILYDSNCYGCFMITLQYNLSSEITEKDARKIVNNDYNRICNMIINDLSKYDLILDKYNCKIIDFSLKYNRNVAIENNSIIVKFQIGEVGIF